MEALGVNINLPPDRVAACLEEVGMAFLFAPAMHSAMKYVQPARRELRLRTVFNLLGPLTNPAACFSASGRSIFRRSGGETRRGISSMLGLHRALVVHGSDGLDEITITGPTRIAEVRDGSVHTYEVTPEEFGMERASLEDDFGRRRRSQRGHHSCDSCGRTLAPPRCGFAERGGCAGGSGPRRSSGDALPLAANSIEFRRGTQKARAR